MADVENARRDSYEKTAEQAGDVQAIHGSYDVADGTVHRKLKNRHMQMIAIGGTIGTGVFVGVGGTLHKGGPLGLLLGYGVMGGLVYAMMVALGEMTTLLPVSGAFNHYAARFLDPAAGFALGWNFWYSSAITLATEVVAGAVMIDYWPGAQHINQAAWISILIAATCAVNFIGVRYYGEAEFWLVVIKLVTLLGLFILGIIITAGGGPSGEAIGFRYWREAPFQQQSGIPGVEGRFLAFWTTLESSAFAYLGTEVVALCAAEAENPRKSIPKAIKLVFWRILFFYITTAFLVGLIVSPNNESLLTGSYSAKSPWVLAIKAAGIKGLPSVVNAVLLSSAFSAGNSSLYAGSRSLYGLACDGKAPALFKKCTKNGLPIYSLAATASFALLGYMVCGNTTSSQAFSYLADLCSVTGLLTWIIIFSSYLKFFYGLRAQGIRRDTFAYKAPLQPYLSWAGLVLTFLIVIFSGYTVFLRGNWNSVTFVMDYISIPILLFCFCFWKLFKRTKMVSLEDMDFVTGRKEFDEISDAYDAQEAAKAPQVWYKRWWDAVQ